MGLSLVKVCKTKYSVPTTECAYSTTIHPHVLPWQVGINQIDNYIMPPPPSTGECFMLHQFATLWSDALSSVMRCVNRFSAVLTQKCTIFILDDDVNNSFLRGNFIQKGGPKQYSGRRNQEHSVKFAGDFGNICHMLPSSVVSFARLRIFGWKGAT